VTFVPGSVVIGTRTGAPLVRLTTLRHGIALARVSTLMDVPWNQLGHRTVGNGREEIVTRPKKLCHRDPGTPVAIVIEGLVHSGV
jgi:hypothetical protein